MQTFRQIRQPLLSSGLDNQLTLPLEQFFSAAPSCVLDDRDDLVYVFWLVNLQFSISLWELYLASLRD